MKLTQKLFLFYLITPLLFFFFLFDVSVYKQEVIEYGISYAWSHGPIYDMANGAYTPVNTVLLLNLEHWIVILIVSISLSLLLSLLFSKYEWFYKFTSVSLKRAVFILILTVILSPIVFYISAWAGMAMTTISCGSGGDSFGGCPLVTVLIPGTTVFLTGVSLYLALILTGLFNLFWKPAATTVKSD